MTRDTIDFGIDLGTTNSAVAVLRGTTTEIIKNNVDADITQSAVHIGKHGQVVTGLHAKNQLENERFAEDVYVEFKRRMGTDHTYTFKSSGRSMKPEDLSAEILKALRGDIQQRLGEEIGSTVITVPAAFEQRQCVATKAAGELAGLMQCPLVQEPVAAALAYGFQTTTSKAYWLVYDFGGGTFDAALMKVEDGNINVVNHGGDNYLGGADIDWAIVEHVLMPQLCEEYNFPDFSRGNSRWRSTIARLKRAVETAKIQLSRSDQAFLEGCVVRDADGEEVDVELKLTRDDVVRAAEPLVMKSIALCVKVLSEKNLPASAVEKLILVGGPTLAPYFREMLASTLRIPIDHSVDPLTVVARGAAVFAGTQRITNKRPSVPKPDELVLDLSYKPVGPEEDPVVRGQVKSSNGNLDGYTIEVSNEQTQWVSGKIPLKADGRFKVSLRAERGFQNNFSISVSDAQGRKHRCTPNTLAYTIGVTITEQTLMNPIGLALANNEVDVFFKKGDGLPSKATKIYRTTHAVKKDASDSILRIPVVEGEMELADRNRELGTLEIVGHKIRRDLPVGSEVEVTLKIDESRVILANAYAPVVDEVFEARIDTNNHSPESNKLRKDYEAEMNRVSALREKSINASSESAESLLDQSVEDEQLERIEHLLVSAKADPDEARKAEKELLDLKIKLDHAENAVGWPSLVSDTRDAVERLEEMLDSAGTEEQKSRARGLKQEIEELIAEKRVDALGRKKEQVIQLIHDILTKVPEFWVGFFGNLVERRSEMSDKTGAERLINLGQQCIQRNNLDGLRSAVIQLLGLLPKDVEEEIKRGYGSGILR